MHEIQPAAPYECPYCGEPGETVLDLSEGDNHFIEDCHVCCRPIEFHLETDGEQWDLEVRAEND
ncbi:CPXCG motif-containing cysteine-rich protein [Pseudomonas sp. UBA1879]|uniref:CPXCG motif-containing cysteine-rich protein n=1 Tax=Pseudomonas sp. UBA1879 TaxID=1947305 RepID=UPI0025D79114|nr:CPXCG motif-containing cysteine-rich protein [Pseudomonas sp. UBA1879]